jgi:protein TonB
MVHAIRSSRIRSTEAPQIRVAAGIIVVHLLILAWILFTPPGRQVLDSASRLIIVQLGDQPIARAPTPVSSGRVTPTKARSAGASVRAAKSASPVTAPPTARAPRVDEGVETGASALATTSPQPGGDASAASPGTGGAVRPHFHPPKTLHSWLPPYPEDAFRGHHQGMVELLVTIDADGTLIAAHVARSSGNESLDRAALESLDRYRFKAADRDGVPVRADAYVTINWVVTPDIVQRVTAPPRIECIDPSNLLNQRKQTQYGSYLKALERERDNDPDRP